MESNSFDDKERDLFRITDDGVFICNFDFEALNNIPKKELWFFVAVMESQALMLRTWLCGKKESIEDFD